MLIACSVSLQKDNLWNKDRHRLCLISIHVIKLCNSSQQSRLACLFVHVLICIPPGRLRHFVQIVRNKTVKARFFGTTNLKIVQSVHPFERVFYNYMFPMATVTFS